MLCVLHDMATKVSLYLYFLTSMQVLAFCAAAPRMLWCQPRFRRRQQAPLLQPHPHAKPLQPRTKPWPAVVVAARMLVEAKMLAGEARTPVGAKTAPPMTIDGRH